MMDEKWIAELKVGDLVFVDRNHTQPRLVRIDNVTRTMVCVGHDKFNRNNGLLRGAGRWDSSMLLPATPERLEEHRIRQMREKIRTTFQHGNVIQKLSVEQLERITAILNEVKKGDK